MPDPNPPNILTEAQRAQYHDQGWVSVPGLVDDDWLIRLRAVTDEFVDQSRGLTESNVVFDLDAGHRADDPRLRRLSSPTDLHETYWEFASQSVIVDVVVDLLGPDVKFHHSKLNFKAPRGGEEVKWHQDIQFWPHTNYDLLTVGVFLEDVEPGMGEVGFVPESHAGPLYDLYDGDVWVGALGESDIERAGIGRAAFPVGPAGSITIHNCRTIHGSAPNASDRARPLLLQTYAAADALSYTDLVRRSPHGEELIRGEPPRWARHDPVPLPPAAIRSVPTHLRRPAARGSRFVKMTRATLVVFGASAAVLVLEIIAGRLMAPYVGISLETFTGIIGTVLAGIAVGAAVGGVLADRYDPRLLIGPGLILGGALAWLSLPIVTGLGPHVDNGPVAIVILTSAAFFLPVAVLSAVSPMVAKLRLASLEQTGTVVGGLSAAGTVGALVGTFVTGFVLVAAIPSKTIVVVVGSVLIAAGIGVTWLLRRRPPALAGVGLFLVVLWSGLNVASTTTPCEHETAYYCVRVEVSAGNPNGRDLYLDRLRHAYVNLEDPTQLDIRYIRIFAGVAAPMPEGSLDALHIGGGGFSFPRYLDAVRPGTKNRVLEIDGELVNIAKQELGLVESEDLQVDIGDARLELGTLPANSYDLVVGDAFAGESVPWHLTTAEVVAEIDRLLRPGGIAMMNVIDGGRSRFARAELATLAAQFEHVAVVLPQTGIPADTPANQVLIASQAPLPELDIDPVDGVVIDGRALTDFIDGARKLTDDYAPVDQLVMSV